MIGDALELLVVLAVVCLFAVLALGGFVRP